METNKAYSKVLTEKKEVAFFKKIDSYKNELDCKEARTLMYGGVNLHVKLNKSISIVPLKKVDFGYIIYLSNNVLSVGDFLFISNWEFAEIERLGLTLDKEQNFNGWRHFWFADKVIAEFVNPLEVLQKQLNTAKNERDNLNDTIERYEKEQIDFIKRFQKQIK